MLITKREPDKELVSRQLKYFDATKALDVKDACREEDGYAYEYVPGQMAVNVNDVVCYLNDNVWSRESLGINDADHYANYIGAICDSHRITLSKVILAMISDVANWEGRNELQHGDATMENFLSTTNGVIGIDPGLPRGFNNRYNDLGKICQSILTQWEWVRHGQRIVWQGDGQTRQMDDYDSVIDTRVLVSLLTHWVRIIKNAARHPPHIEEYARLVVLPTLIEELENNHYQTYHWGYGNLIPLRQKFYRAAEQYARHA